MNIINTNSEVKTYKEYTIGAGAILNVPKRDAKAFIKKYNGVDWAPKASPTEVKKKDVPKSTEAPQVKVGERGDI